MLGPYKWKRKWCLKLKNYPLYNIDIDIGYDFKVKQVLALVLNSKKSGNQQIFDFEPKPTFIAQLWSSLYAEKLQKLSFSADFSADFPPV